MVKIAPQKIKYWLNLIFSQPQIFILFPKNVKDYLMTKLTLGLKVSK